MCALSPIFVLKRRGKPVVDLEFWNCDYDSMLISAYGAKGGIDIWSLKTRRPTLSISSDAAMLSTHGLSFGELLTLDKDGDLKLIDINNGSPRNKLRLTVPNVAFCKAAVWSAVSSKPKQLVAIPGEDKSSINVWNLYEKTIISQLIPALHFKLGMPWCIKLLGQNRPLALIGYEDGSIICWDVFERKILVKGIGLFTDPVMCFDAHENNDNSITGAAGSATDCIVKWNFNSHELIKDVSKSAAIRDFSIIRKHKLINEGLSSMKIRQDNKILATGGWDNKTRLFAWKNLRPLAVLDYHTGSIQSLAFSDDKLLACGSTDHKISVWKIFTD